MNLLFRKKKLVLKAYTYNSCAYEFFTVAKAHHFYPEWWKKLPSYHEQVVGVMNMRAPTMKTCAGIIDIYKHGLVLPLWSDLQIKIAEHGQWAGMFSDDSCKQPTSHPRYQIGEENAESDDCIHVKLDAPWLLVDVNKTGVSFLETGCFWNNISTQYMLQICPGVLNFKYQHSMNINTLVSKTPREFVIPANTPMTQIIPLSDRPLELQVELVSREDFFRINDKHAAACFYNKYERLKKITMQKEMQSKCPFSRLFAK
jgi:hypothetical protein